MKHLHLTIWNFGRWTNQSAHIDFQQYGTGMVRLTGPNECGKSTIIDALNPFGEPLRRKSLARYANSGLGGFEHSFECQGHVYVRRYFITKRQRRKDGEWVTGSPTIQLFQDGKMIAQGANQYREVIPTIVGPKIQFYSCAFQGQKAMKNRAGAVDFVDADPRDREAMFRHILGLGQIEARRNACSRFVEAAAEEIRRLQPKIDRIEEIDGQIVDGVAQRDELAARVEELTASAGLAALEVQRLQELYDLCKSAANLHTASQRHEAAKSEQDTAQRACDTAATEAETSAERFRSLELASANVADLARRRASQQTRVDEAKRAEAAAAERASRSALAIASLKRRADAAAADRERLTPKVEAANAAVAAAAAKAAEAEAAQEEQRELLEQTMANQRQAKEASAAATQAWRETSKEMGEAQNALNTAVSALAHAKKTIGRAADLPFGEDCVQAKCSFVADIQEAKVNVERLEAEKQSALERMHRAESAADDASATQQLAEQAEQELNEGAQAVLQRGNDLAAACQAARQAHSQAVADARSLEQQLQAIAAPSDTERSAAQAALAEAQKAETDSAASVQREVDALAQIPAADSDQAAELEAARQSAEADKRAAAAANDALTEAKLKTERARAAADALGPINETLDAIHKSGLCSASRDRPDLLIATAAGHVHTAITNLQSAQATEAQASAAAKGAETDHLRCVAALDQRMDDRAKLATAEAEIAGYRAEHRRWSWLRGEFDRLIQAMVESSGPGVSDRCNELLERAYGPRFSIRLEPATKNASNDNYQRTYKVWVTDQSPPYGERVTEVELDEFSGAGQTMLGQAILAGLKLFATSRSGWDLRSNVLDEADAALDPKFRGPWQQMVRHYMEQCGEEMTIYFVSHADTGIDADNEIDIANLPTTDVDPKNLAQLVKDSQAA